MAKSIILFTTKNQFAGIFAIGSTKSRTRLYRMGITKFWNEIDEQFTVLGLYQDKWQPFTAKTDYDAFLVYRKMNVI